MKNLDVIREYVVKLNCSIIKSVRLHKGGVKSSQEDKKYKVLVEEINLRRC
ncbi:MAG: hypothetical protein ACI8WT_004518 [Clostridium sp.]|jgi:hypothetical protein